MDFVILSQCELLPDHMLQGTMGKRMLSMRLVMLLLVMLLLVMLQAFHLYLT